MDDVKKYTPKYFKENIPEWKRKKDPILSKIFYRPVSFVLSSIATKLGIGPNAISYFSMVIGILACVCFLIPVFAVKIIGAILVNVWLLLDCTDGNIARSVRRQTFGEFADGISSYILVGLLCTCMGISAYFTGGVLFPKECIWILLIGVFASTADSLMRLIYQKYKNIERDMVDKRYIEAEKEKRTDHSEVGSLRVRIEAELGIGGILPILVLLGTIFNFLDLVLIYCLAYYGSACIVSTLMYIRKAISKTKDIEIDN